MKRKLIWAGLFLLIAFAIYRTQSDLMKKTDPEWKTESFSYLPGNERIKDYLFGYETTLSHYLWIRTVIYFGDHYKKDKKYTWIVSMIDMITKLNPYFYPAYEFAGLLLPDITDNPGLSRIFLERGLTHLKSGQWKLSFYLGMLYYQSYNDTYKAAFYFDLASRAPGAHREKLAGLAAVFYRKAGLEDYGLSYLRMMYEISDNPEVKRHILEKIDKFVHDDKIR